MSPVPIVIGGTLFLVGIAKLARGERGGFNLSNIGISICGTTIQRNSLVSVTHQQNKNGKPDWVGLAIAAIGLIAALVGLFKG